MIDEYLFISDFGESRGAREQTDTHWELVKTTDIESELQRKRFGAITRARLAGVIFVMLCVFSSKNIWRKLTTNSRTRRLIVGNRWTI